MHSTIPAAKKSSGPNRFFDFLYSWREYSRFKKLPASSRAIVFYSESGQDWHHFRPIIEHITGALGRTVCYAGSDCNDEGLHGSNPRVLPFYIRRGLLQMIFFQFLKADVCVLTMIDLQVMHVKRSINKVHYVYLFHSMGSTHMVDNENSYDFYDTILCVGPHQIKEIRRREELEGLRQKNLVEHGYARVEHLMALAEKHPRPKRPENEKATVLVAPTWGENSILHICGKPLIAALLMAGFNVILRPHYQTVRRSPGLISDILDTYGNDRRLRYVDKMGDTDSLLESDMLVCDWSSTSIEYALGLAKPVLYIDVPRRVHNPNYEKLGIVPLEISIREKVGAVLAVEDIAGAPERIDTLLAEPEKFRTHIAGLRQEIVFNLGRSVEVGAREINRLALETEKDNSRI
jgi:YidC/Oxa1 family membrane protein insertase